MRHALRALLLLSLTTPAAAKVARSSATAFTIEDSVVVPGTPEAVFDAMTGDVSGWWDHTFSAKPKRLVIEPRVGGAFLEIFDDAGNGTQHATVTYVDRGKRLRFVGPLGLAGQAIEMIHTIDFSPAAPGMTQVKLTVRGLGEIEKEWPPLVDQVWHHFLAERFKPYMEARATAPKKPIK
ncbi:MAG TPA: SRPBCC domain-containing protein [Polyangia bacterium]|jgi:uncharacterized protein YndB with AHSA1/START domain|nr:SRPBCC domain-containing protein [Polyangia bacterium]